jgi:hypothetical protein
VPCSDSCTAATRMGWLYLSVREQRGRQVDTERLGSLDSGHQLKHAIRYLSPRLGEIYGCYPSPMTLD